MVEQLACDQTLLNARAANYDDDLLSLKRSRA